jgi:hypothetical protein
MKYIKTFENMKNTYTMYSGISLSKWEEIWKDKNLRDMPTNVTSDIDFAFDYSYDFKTGNYDDAVVEISNIPIEAFVSCREDEYEDDDDFIPLNNMNNKEKEYYLDNYSLFVVYLFKYKDIIETKLIQK